MKLTAHPDQVPRNPAQPGKILQPAIAAAHEAEQILAERQHGADRTGEVLGVDFMRRREAEAGVEAAVRQAAVRQDPVPSRHASSLERDELKLEAGQ
jgi:hypothetical protein